MIESRKDYLTYLEKDRIALAQARKKPRLFADEVWRFERRLLRLGFDIPCNVFGPGLSIAHYGNIVVNGAARIGTNCRIHAGVNIGTQAGATFQAPKIGDNVYIGPGAKIFGPIQIAGGIAIGANSVVNKSFTEPDISIAGVPARKISAKGSEGLMAH